MSALGQERTATPTSQLTANGPTFTYAMHRRKSESERVMSSTARRLVTVLVQRTQCVERLEEDVQGDRFTENFNPHFRRFRSI